MMQDQVYKPQPVLWKNIYWSNVIAMIFFLATEYDTFELDEIVFIFGEI